MAHRDPPKIPPYLLELAEGDYHLTRAKYDPARLKTCLIGVYGGRMARVYAEDLEHIEAQLDDEWPGWRVKQPFPGLQFDTTARIKTLLKQRRHILIGFGDWAVKIIDHDGHPIALSIAPEVQRQAVEAGAPLPDPRKTRVSASVLAVKMGAPLERVETAMDEWDPDKEPNARAFVAAWLDAHKPEPAPPAKRKKAATDEG
jgi:hypothetical protein